MKVAFYRAEYGTWFDKLIAKITGSEFSHCELVFSNGTCFSASNRDGVRFAKIDFKEHWVLIDVPLTAEQEYAMLAWCTKQVNPKYDWLGVFLGWAGIQQSSRWFCSEICAEALMACTDQKMFKPYKSISPQLLLEALT